MKFSLKKLISALLFVAFFVIVALFFISAEKQPAAAVLGLSGVFLLFAFAHDHAVREECDKLRPIIESLQERLVAGLHSAVKALDISPSSSSPAAPVSTGIAVNVVPQPPIQAPVLSVAPTPAPVAQVAPALTPAPTITPGIPIAPAAVPVVAAA
ncbi:hypothetical protein ACODYM_29415 [Burkholderia gladioli]|uniref:hypothetical protein n=1 Tax=Burkholderia gladioli TaxID=28095 RepID=UPI003B5078FE